MSEPEVTQKAPFVENVKPSTYAWCSCGKASGPYCDGSHAGTGFKPMIVKIEEEKKVAWCGCRKSGNNPYCDGSHSKL